MRYPIRRLVAASALTAAMLVPWLATRAQQPDEFRSLYGRFGIQLSQTYSYKSTVIEIANYPFPVSLYRWKTERDTFTICVADGVNNLEEPENAKLFLSDFSGQVKKTGKLITEHEWMFQGHPGFELVKEENETRVYLRVFVIGNRFYSLNIGVAAPQELSLSQRQALESFHLLSSAEVAEDIERLVETFAPPAPPPEPAVRRVRSDLEDANLRGSVQRVFVEEARLSSGGSIGLSHPVSRDDFDPQGYLVSKVGYSNYLPSAVWKYGYSNGVRVFSQATRKSDLAMALPPALGSHRESGFPLHKVEYKYNSAGSLTDIRVIGPDGKIEEHFAIKYDGHRREISYSRLSYSGNHLASDSKTVMNLDNDGNPITEIQTDYSEVPAFDSLRGVERQINTHDVISGAITTGSAPTYNSSGMKKTSVSDVVQNPNRTERVYQSTQAVTSRKESEIVYSYTYEYDSHHNWIKRTKTKTTKSKGPSTTAPISVTYRTITYY